MIEGAKKILYVDDERVNLILFEHAFKRHFSVVCVDSPEAALLRCKTETFAVVVSDQRMPGMSGLQLLTTMRELYPQTVRMILTAYPNNAEILDAVAAGLVNAYLVKPWTADEVQQLLADGLHLYDSQRQ